MRFPSQQPRFHPHSTPTDAAPQIKATGVCSVPVLCQSLHHSSFIIHSSFCCFSSKSLSALSSVVLNTPYTQMERAVPGNLEATTSPASTHICHHWLPRVSGSGCLQSDAFRVHLLSRRLCRPIWFSFLPFYGDAQQLS